VHIENANSSALNNINIYSVKQGVARNFTLITKYWLVPGMDSNVSISL
jgi:hypothetical protein